MNLHSISFPLRNKVFQEKNSKGIIVCILLHIYPILVIANSHIFPSVAREEKSTEKINNYGITKLDKGSDVSGITISEILLNDKPYNPNSKSLYSSIPADNNTTLYIKENDVLNISLGFSSRRLPKKLRVEYKINDSQWFPVDAGKPHLLLYHLSAGQYTVSIQALNNKSKVFATSSIMLQVKASWWRNGWLLGICCSLVLFIVVAYFIYWLNHKKLLQQLKEEKLAVINHKTAFNIKLANIAEVTHEFSTPLMLLLNTLERIREKGKYEDGKQLDTIETNIQRLKKLTYELTEVNTSEKKDEVFMVSSYDIVSFVQKTFQLFEELAESNHIQLQFKCNADAATVWFNKEQLEKVVFNLLSNAFKFTPANGAICITIDCPLESAPSQEISITIADTGIGIEEFELDKIFQKKYSSKPVNYYGFESSGIGLSLCKKLIELHHGRITVKSKKGTGTTFTISLKTGTEHFQKEQLLRIKLPQTNMRSAIRPSNKTINTLKNEKVMVVEDNKEMREYIEELLSTHYNVLLAKSGVDGIESIKVHLPDLIITDLSMEGKDGKALILEVRKDELTSHIPIVVLSSFACDDIKAEVLAAGADTYLTKPCDKRLILASVESLLHSRANLRKLFSHSITEMEEVAQKPSDSNLLKRAMTIIDRHMSDPDFDVAALAAKLNVSRSFLYLKFSNFTSYSPKDFIHIMRVRKGAKLIKSGRYNINEASDEIGYNNVKNFRKYFKFYFGASPSLFIRNHRFKN